MEKTSSRLRDFLRDAPLGAIQRAAKSIDMPIGSGTDRRNLLWRMRDLTGQHVFTGKAPGKTLAQSMEVVHPEMKGFDRMIGPEVSENRLLRTGPEAKLNTVQIIPTGSPTRLPPPNPKTTAFRGAGATAAEQDNHFPAYTSALPDVSTGYVAKALGYSSNRPAVMHVMDVKDLRFVVHPERKGVPHWTRQLCTDNPEYIRKGIPQSDTGFAGLDPRPEYEGVVTNIVPGKYFRPVKPDGTPYESAKGMPRRPYDLNWEPVDLKVRPAAQRWLADRAKLLAPEKTAALHFATANWRKRNIAKRLMGKDVKAITDLEQVEETGKTFRANAILKARHGAEVTGKPTFADDSGLCVAALDGAPGVITKRWSGGDGHANAKKLLEQLQGHRDRRAKFVSCVALATPDGKVKTFTGVHHGRILDKPVSAKHTYDSLFYSLEHGRTLDKVDAKTRDEASSVGRAIKKLMQSQE